MANNKKLTRGEIARKQSQCKWDLNHKLPQSRRFSVDVFWSQTLKKFVTIPEN